MRGTLAYETPIFTFYHYITIFYIQKMIFINKIFNYNLLRNMSINIGVKNKNY
jgi:hypothetical protein